MQHTQTLTHTRIQYTHTPMHTASTDTHTHTDHTADGAIEADVVQTMTRRRSFKFIFFATVMHGQNIGMPKETPPESISDLNSVVLLLLPESVF